MSSFERRKGLRAAVSLAWVVGFGTAFAPPAFAAEPGAGAVPIHVITIQSTDVDDQADALTKALRAAVRASTGWSLAASDHSLEVLTLNLKCHEPPDAACQTRIGEQLNAERFIWGMIGKKGKDVTGALHLWTRNKGTTDVPIDYSANLTEADDESLRRVATEALAKLTGGDPKGVVRIRTGSASEGDVFVDGQQAARLSAGQATLNLTAGSHKILIKAVGYMDLEASLTISLNAPPGEVTLAPVPIDTSQETNWKRVGGYGSLGLGVALGVVGLVSSVQVNGVMNDSLYQAYRTQVPTSPDRCNDAAGTGKFPDPNPAIVDLCNKGKTFQTLQFVAYPLAAAFAGVGIYLLATGPRPANPFGSVQVTPAVGVNSGRVDVTYTW